MPRILLTKKAVMACYNNNQSDMARALGRTRQAVGLWRRYLPELAARHAIDLHPELAAQARTAKLKPRKNGRRGPPATW